jgi:hypothetical protein
MTRTEAMVVRKQIVVNAAIARAFMAFTERFGDFKPPEHNLLQAHRRPRGRRQRVPLGPHPGLRTTAPRGVQLGHQSTVADRDRSGADQRGRGPVRRRGPGPNPRRTGTPPPRPPRPGLAVGRRERRRRPGLAAVSRPLRRPVRPGELTRCPTTATRTHVSGAEEPHSLLYFNVRGSLGELGCRSTDVVDGGPATE